MSLFVVIIFRSWRILLVLLFEGVVLVSIDMVLILSLLVIWVMLMLVF